MLIGPVVALAIVSYELTRPSQLFGVFAYDDGVYYGVAARLVHGALPYRDFVFLHPPGIAIVLSPVALIGRLVGSQVGIALARVLTGAIAIANVALVGRLVRHRGVIAVTIATLSIALYPLAIAADHTVLLDPYLVFFSLIGLNLVFRNGSLIANRSLAYGGLALGFAGAIKIEAILPALGVLAVTLYRARRRAGGLVLGTATGFLAPCLPFLLVAPHAFLHDVLITQLDRAPSALSGMPVLSRIVALSGIGGLTAIHIGLHVQESIAIIVVVVWAAVVAWRRTSLDDLGRVCLLIALCSTITVLVIPEFYLYYAYFPVCFFSVVIGSICGDLAGALPAPNINLSRGLFVTFVVLAGWLLEQNLSYASAFITADAPQPVAAILAPTIPRGACVIFDEAILAIVADRFDSSGPCPKLVDPFGTWLAAAPQNPPPSADPPAALVATWERWLSQADFLVEVAPRSDFIPWTPALVTWFNQRFTLVVAAPKIYEYANIQRR